ncbi:uncharacterized protein LOC117222528 [Megalopta genalis]|uniref:uncharacterized protein LOC117222528 n=1 Tax=Megalopta genalis TaxID=115081 RepID=UPI003FD40C80
MRVRTTRTKDFKDHKGCLLFRATDFASLMRPITFFSGIFGFFPCNYKSEEYVFSKKKFVYSIIIICLHLVLQVYNFLLANFLDTIKSITKSMSDNMFVLLDGSLPLLLFAAPFSMSAMFDQLSKLSRTLPRQDFSDMAKVIRTVCIVNAVFYVCLIPACYFNVFKITMLRLSISLYFAVSSTTSVLCYISCVPVLGACLKKLNEDLKQLNRSSPDLHVELAEKQLSRRQSTMLLMKVKYYEEVHENISDAVEHLNRLFRTVVIFYTTSTFVSVTLSLYNMFTKWDTSGDRITTIDILFISVGLLYSSLRFGMFCVIVWFCETAANHAADIVITIHDCVSHCTDNTVKRELKYFVLQVIHRDITFTTKAFDINGKLLSQILSAIFMYVMILYQFLTGSNCTN